jgi:hypothetical protein
VVCWLSTFAPCGLHKMQICSLVGSARNAIWRPLLTSLIPWLYNFSLDNS